MEMLDRYGKQMWTFVGKATSQLEDLVDDVNHADSTFNDVLRYYGEDDHNMSSSEFYGIFKTFVTSYKVSFFCCLRSEVTDTRYAIRNARQRIQPLQRRNCLHRSEDRRPRKRRPIGPRLGRKLRSKMLRTQQSSITSWRNCELATTSGVRAAEHDQARRADRVVLLHSTLKMCSLVEILETTLRTLR